MFTIERKEGESLVIQHKGEELFIKLVETQKGRVKLDLEGPASFGVNRKELVEVVRYIEVLLNKSKSQNS